MEASVSDTEIRSGRGLGRRLLGFEFEYSLPVDEISLTVGFLSILEARTVRTDQPLPSLSSALFLLFPVYSSILTTYHKSP